MMERLAMNLAMNLINKNMKRIILQLLLLAATISVSAQIKTDAELTTQSNVIRNTTDPKALTPTVIANMQQAIIDSKLNKNAFANVTASGTGTYTATVFPAITAYDNLRIIVTFTHANTGAATLNFNSIGAAQIRKIDSGVLTALAANDIADGQAFLLVYDGTYFQIIGGSGGVSDFADLTGKPTTLSGYGITDAVANTVTVNSHPLNSNVTVTASDLSLGNVNNTSDVNKPVSTAQAAADALNLKIASNLSDLNSASTARTNLGLGTLATQSGTFSGSSSGTNTGDQDLSGKANLAGPTFTGTVTLPSTTSIGTVSSTEIGYVDNVTSAIQTQLDAKAPLASPTFTGTPTLPTGTIATTQATGTNNTTVATTAFVSQEKGLQLGATQTGDYTLVLGDKGYRIEMNKATALTLTVPPNSSVAFPTGTVIYPVRTGAGTLTIAQGAGVTITGSSGALTDPGQNVEMKLVKTGTDTWLLQNGSPGVWLDWTTTFVGFSSNPPYVFRYTVIGKTVFYYFTMTSDGTSNSTSFTITLPFAGKTGVNQFHTMAFVVNNSAAGASPGRIQITSASNVASLGRDATGAVWTASGGKRASGSGSYETD
jgi:hypothetical protein